MAKTITVAGKKLHARTCTANEWFDARELEDKRAQDFRLISICILDEDGKQVYSEKEVGDLPITTFSYLYGLALEANLPPKDAAKN